MQAPAPLSGIKRAFVAQESGARPIKRASLSAAEATDAVEKEVVEDVEEQLLSDDDEEPAASMRFSVPIDEGGTSVSWRALLQRREKEMEKERKESLEISEVDEEEESQDKSLSAGSYYDTDDSFIDDSEMFDAAEANKIETEVKGFFVQSGDIAVREKEAKQPKPKVKKPKTKAPTPIVPDVVKGPFSEWPNLEDALQCLRDVVHNYADAIKQAGDRLDKIPEEVEAALMVVEDEIRSLNLRKRGAVYESLTKLFLTTNTKTLKDRIKRLYVHWLPTKHERSIKKVVNKVKRRIKKDVSDYQKALVEKNASAPNVTQSKKTGEFKYRCRWDIFAADLIKIGDLVGLFVDASNTSRKRKSRGVEEVELLDVEKERRNAMRLLLECWPASCTVSNQNLNVAYRRYRSKRDSEAAATTAPDTETGGGSTDNKMTSQLSKMKVSTPKFRSFSTATAAKTPAATAAATSTVTPSPAAPSAAAAATASPVGGSVPVVGRSASFVLPPVSSVFDSLPADPWSSGHFRTMDQPPLSLSLPTLSSLSPSRSPSRSIPLITSSLPDSDTKQAKPFIQGASKPAHNATNKV